jgi:dihydroxy-acid dehydratase
MARTGYKQGRPVIGIAMTSSALNPCHGDVDRLVEGAVEGVIAAGGTPAAFPAMSLGEDLMKPSAMLYRNLLSMELEESARSYPLDGLVIFAGCDKNVPAALMALASANIPGLVALVGTRRPGALGNRRIAAGTDVWRELEKRRAGRSSDAEWAGFEACLRSVGPGICNVMGTAVTMGILAEFLGMAMPKSATMVAGSVELLEVAQRTGGRVVDMVWEDSRPADRMTAAAFRNCLVALAAVGGSTNALIHLAAIAGRLGIDLDAETIDSALRDVPLLVDVEPCGTGVAQDFHDAGATPALANVLAGLLDLDCLSADGRSWLEVSGQCRPRTRTIRLLDDPLLPAPTLAVLRGSLAPGGAVVKVAAASPQLLQHEGPAVVFNTYEDMRQRLDDRDLEIEPDSVLVVRECGPVGAPGMPEWGMAPIPRRLVEAGVRDMVRVTDGRMSGTSFGTVILHVTPEAAIGGPLALIRDGDLVRLDVPERRIDLIVDIGEMNRRQEEWQPPISKHSRGWPALYQQHVLDAAHGCDFDILTTAPGERAPFIEPVVGRS